MFLGGGSWFPVGLPASDTHTGVPLNSATSCQPTASFLSEAASYGPGHSWTVSDQYISKAHAKYFSSSLAGEHLLIGLFWGDKSRETPFKNSAV